MQYLWKKQESLHLGPFKQDKDCQGEEESTLATLCQKLQVKKGLILRRGKLIGFETKQDQHSCTKDVGRRVTASLNSIIPFKKDKGCQGEGGG